MVALENELSLRKWHSHMLPYRIERLRCRVLRFRYGSGWNWPKLPSKQGKFVVQVFMPGCRWTPEDRRYRNHAWWQRIKNGNA